jgi:predicted tellurium resistance membrane protein TerC
LRTIVIAIALVAFTDVTLQLDNALAVSAVASTLDKHRPLVLAVGVLLSAVCLLGFTLVGASLIQRAAWLKPVAGFVLVVVGARLAWDFFAPFLAR